MRSAAKLTRPLLRPGDRIEVVAPGFRCSDELLLRGVEFLRGLGLVPRVPPALFGKDLLCANTDRVRFAQLRRALAARDSHGIWCVRGGYGAMRLVPALLDLAPPRRKLFIGYSDATTLHYFLNLHWNWPSLHGPLLDRLGTGQVDTQELGELEAVLLAGQSEVAFAELIPLNGSARRARRIRGRVFGGNLAVLQTIAGTALQRRGREILFLEDIGERGYRVDRMLQHLLQSGMLRGVQAIVLGDFIGGQEPDGRNLVLPVLERFADEQGLPMLRGMRAGHGEHQRPVFFNTPAELTCGRAPELVIRTPVIARQ
jgi:muramoyltetrapeptide carboxypeptidase